MTPIYQKNVVAAKQPWKNQGGHSKPSNILMTIAGLDQSAGGPSKSVTALAESVASEEMKVSLYTLDAGQELSVSIEDDLKYELQLYKTNGSFFNRRHALIRMAEDLKKRLKLSDSCLLHNHGLWLTVNRLSAQVARKTGVPLVISTRGMAEPWALNYRKRKKQLAWFLYQNRDLKSARILHATSEQEAKSLRGLGLKNPIAVVPNGVDIPPLRKEIKKSERLRTLLFLSRIHPVKGLVNLVDAWNLVRPKGWRVLIVGPDEVGHRKELQERISRYQLNNQFEFIGPVYDQRKLKLFSNADVFILPSFSENFGIAVAEALANGIPVITTKGTPWRDLVSNNCGWWVDTGVEPLAEAIRDALSLSDTERVEMGLRGRDLIKNSYTWPKIAFDMVLIYNWVLGGGAPPGCVVTD